MAKYSAPVPQTNNVVVPNIEDTLRMLAQNANETNKQNNQRMQKFESHLDILAQSQLKFQQTIQDQISHLTTALTERSKGTLPNQPEPNPRGKGVYHVENSSGSNQQNEHVNSIVTLRLGKQIDNKVELPQQKEK
ncbi:hypothetical protein BVC80_1399g2 [Macleaya cordata]|uniref:Uncharacterized protein n=1 Tax=Macleaya cordata TaxID=56857 RepID=A0A200Q1V3_MACCD|nr:hypothetical protein BVC80_1399g2 [Macleaya cordata]